MEDEAILYAMRNQKDGAKGIFVNGYGTYSDSVSNSIIEQIAVNEDDKDDWTIEIWIRMTELENVLQQRNIKPTAMRLLN